jgi:hypothetical protein
MQSGSRVAPAQDALTQLSSKLRGVDGGGGPASSADCRTNADRTAHFIVISMQIIGLDTFTLNHTVDHGLCFRSRAPLRGPARPRGEKRGDLVTGVGRVAN